MSVEGFPVEIFNVVGAGDGFLSGFLYGWLRGEAWDQCARFGNACGAIVVSRHGCSPASPTRAELDWFLSQERLRPDLRKDEELEELHWATTRPARSEPLVIIACDHLDSFANFACASERSVAGFKVAVAGAALDLQTSIPGLGVIFDDAEGSDALQLLGSDMKWVARKIEAHNERPLAFLHGRPAATLMHEWPRYHIAKCLVPDVEQSDTVLQNERLCELYRAARMYGIEILLELVSEDTLEGAERVLSRLTDIQHLGVKPDWWKLPAFSDPAVWPKIEMGIKEENAYCRGVLLSAHGRDFLETAQCSTATERVPIIKGVVIGRSILDGMAEEWLAQRINSAELTQRLSERLRTLIPASWLPKRHVA